MTVFPLFAITKPLLLLDVDGVLIPYAAQAQPLHFGSYTLLDEQVWLTPCHGDWLRPLCDLFDVVWATGWEHDANRLIAPILDLPTFPVIEFARDAAGRFEKFPAIAQIVPDQPLVWIDDYLAPEAYAWAAQRPAPTLLIEVDPACGLTQEMAATCTAFAADLCGRTTGHIR